MKAKVNHNKSLQFNSHNNCLNFFEYSRRTNEYNYVNVIEDKTGGCSSRLGKTKPGQLLKLGYKCYTEKIIIHEFIHAIGFAHEQSRYDRDSYVKINWENVKGGKNNTNFWKVNKYWLTGGTEYDGKSVMHYPGNHHSIDNKTTITSLVC